MSLNGSHDSLAPGLLLQGKESSDDLLRTVTAFSVVAYRMMGYADSDFAHLERAAHLADSSAGVRPPHFH